MTIRIFSGSCIRNVEKEVNDFISGVDNKQIIDIKMTECQEDISVLVILK